MHVTQNDYEPDLLLAVSGPFLLIQIALVARFYLSKTTRFPTYASERQRSIAGLAAATAGKVLLVFLTLPLLFGDWTGQKTLEIRRAAILLMMLLTCFTFRVFTVIYTFDMTFRRISLGIWVHHITAVALTFVILRYGCNYDASDDFCGGVMAMFYTLGEFADIIADSSVMIYYVAEYSQTTANILTLCARIAGLIRVPQWALILQLCYITPFHWQMGVFLTGSVWWIKEEIHEYKVLSGIAAKVQRIVNDQMFHSPEVWEPSSPVRAWFDDIYRL